MEELRRKGEGQKEALLHFGGPYDGQWPDKDLLDAQGLVQLPRGWVKQHRAFAPLKHQLLSFTVKHLVTKLLVKFQVLPAPLSSQAAPLLSLPIPSTPRYFSSTGVIFGYFFL